MILSGLLIAVPACPQSQGPASQASTSAAPAKTSPPPDKARAQKALQEGRRAEQTADWKAAYADYSEASAYAPSNREYSILKEHARFQLVQSIIDSAERQALAGNIPGARALLRQALEIDPGYAVAQERLAELNPDSAATPTEKGPRLAGLPRLHPKPGMLDFDYRGTTRGAYGEIGRQFGVTVVFDGDLADRAIRFRAPHVDFDTAVMVLSRQTKTFARVADEHTLFVAEDNAQNQRQYAPEIEKSIVLPESVSTDEMNETVRMIREITGISRTQLDTSSRTLTIRSTEQNVALAQALLHQIEQPHGDLMLEIEILEVDRDTATQLGITPPTSTSVFTLSPTQIQQLKSAVNATTFLQDLEAIFGSISGLGASAGGVSSVLPPVIPFGGGKSIFLATVPGATANFSQTLSAVRSAQRILLRAQDGKPATFFVGDRYPIDFGLLSSGLIGSGSPLSSSIAAALLSGLGLPRTDYTVGAGPDAVALGVLTTNGFQDIVVANKSDGTISILLGNGDGTFGTPIPISMPTGASPAAPSAIALGDFNADGRVDIAVTDSANNNVAIFLGNGDGTFAKPLSYPTGTKPVALITQDFNGTGALDLAVANAGDGVNASTVSVLLGNLTNGIPNGTFAAKTDYPVDVAPSAIVSADFNGDSFLDLAVSNHGSNTVSILLGNGRGGFVTKTDYATGNGPAGIATADFNLDGFTDLAVTNQTDGTVSILKGNGLGAFFPQIAYAAGNGPAGILAGNFTGSFPDAVVAAQTDNDAGVLIGNGDGTLNAPIPLPTGNGPVAVASADLNGDGTLDLVTANESSNSVTVTLNSIPPSSTASSAQTGYPSADYVDLGLKIKATPRLHSGNEVTLHLEFDIKSLAGTALNGIPILSNRSIDQTVRLRENETSILSGILQTSEASSVTGLPWASTLPAIGDLTGENTSDNQQTEILILVTPRALQSPPHNMPAIYAGRGEPSTPAGPPIPVPAPPGQPGPPQAQPGPQPGQPGLPPGAQPPATPGAVPQPGQAPGGIFQQRPPS